MYYPTKSNKTILRQNGIQKSGISDPIHPIHFMRLEQLAAVKSVNADEKALREIQSFKTPQEVIPDANPAENALKSVNASISSRHIRKLFSSQVYLRQ